MRAEYKVITKQIEVARFGDPITIYFFGDVHRDSPSCDVDRWRDFLSLAEKTMDENTYFIGMGDYHDFASTSEKKKIRDNELHESTLARFDLLAEQDNRNFCKEIGFMRGKLLGLIEGNHSWVFQSGKRSTDDLAERMGTDELGWLCHLSLKIKYDKKHRNNTADYPVHMVLCHGKAGGKTLGITVNQVGDLKNIFPVADLYCMGHDHQRIAHPTDILHPVSTPNGIYTIKQKRQYLCRSGSFCRAYVNNSTSYEISRLYRPSDLGVLKVILNHRRSQRDNTDVEYLDIKAEI